MKKQSFEEGLVETIMRQIDITEEQAHSFAKGLMEGKIPYLLTSSGKIEIK